VVIVTSSPPPWLSDRELSAWMAFTGVLMTLPAAVDAQLKRDAGMNFFEYTILASLSESPGRSARTTVLAQLASGSVSRLSHAVSRLEGQGWVTRRTGELGPRSTEVVLTDAGMAVLLAAAPSHVREARRLVVDALSPAQLGQLSRICRQLLATAAPQAVTLLDEAIEARRSQA
jgi:DNA-binding MarR family transcriptional regulator